MTASARTVPASAGAERRESALYEGWIEHVRRQPVERRFRYRIALAWLDLAELPEVLEGRLWTSARRPAPLRFRRSDHLGDPVRPLAECVADEVERASGRRPTGPIRLLTQLRQWGYGFNPASFYYCFAPDGRGLEHVAVEVTNTPWGERHVYVASQAPPHGVAGSRGGGALVDRAEKVFHVSPFLGVEGDYRLRFAPPGERLGLSIVYRSQARPRLTAELEARRLPWCDASLRRLLVRHFARPARLHAAIHWQALRLWWAGVPFHPHPGHAADAESSRGGSLRRTGAPTPEVPSR